MSSGTEISTVHSEAELRVVTIKTEAGDIVKYSGNPAELPGARHEIRKALRRNGAFSLVVTTLHASDPGQSVLKTSTT